MSGLNKGLLIEFYGLPGSGKSTLADKVGNELGRRGFTIRDEAYSMGNRMGVYKRILSKILYVLPFLLFHPLQAIRLYRISGSIAAANKGIHKQLFNMYLVLSLSRQRRKDSVIRILDQGIVQAIVSMLYNSEENGFKEAAEALTGYIDRDTVLVYIKAEPESALARMDKRGKHGSRIEKEPGSDNEKINMLYNMTKQFDCLTGLLSQYDVLCYENNGNDCNKLVAALVNEIERRIS